MTEQNCPMCGKSNPADLDVCQFCEARLKPLHITSPFSEEEPLTPGDTPTHKQTSDLEAGLPDWLRGLRGGEDEPAGQAQEGDVPDWLGRSEPAAPPPPAAQPDAGLPDWLSGFRDEAPEESAPDEDAPDWLSGSSSEAQENLPDWLSNMGSDPGTSDEAAPSGAAASDEAVPAGDEPAWLQQIRSRQQTEEPEQEAAGFDAPDFSQEPASADLSGDAQPDIRDWLASLEPAETTPAVPESSEMPSWMSAGPGPDDEPDTEFEAEPASDLPDWLSRPGEEPGLPAEASQDLFAEEGADQSAFEADIPDWMAQAADEQAAPAEGLPDWLSSETAGPAAPQPPAPAESLYKPAFDEDIPDWMTGEGEELEEGLPAWMTGLVAQSPSGPGEGIGADEAPPTGAGIPAQPPVSEDLPDWLNELSQSSAVNASPSQPAAGDEFADWMSGAAPAEPASPAEEASQPSWSAFFDADSPQDQAQEDISAAEPAEDVPDWLRGMDAAAPPLAGEGDLPLSPASGASPFSEETEEADLEPLYDGEIPNWLGEETPAEAAQAAEHDPNLAPAELPSWLEAMRPMDSSAVGSPMFGGGAGPVESAGPLAGLQGVLPAEPVINELQKPGAYSSRLHVSDSQQANAGLFEQMVAREGVASPLPRRLPFSSQHILRIVIALVLIVSILFPLATGIPNSTLPLPPPETAAAYDFIARLGAGSTVLLGFDYQPGMSGEMDALAAAMVDHLMLKGAYLALVSTTPTGPLQGERLVEIANRQTSQRGGQPYQPTAQYANLGFIPGGPAGLISFAQAPRQTMPFTLDGLSIWSAPDSPLQNVAALSDFDLVIVFTENPDTARSWIEQVAPALGDATPLVMGVSAQAEPVVRPYYDGIPRQVQGLVTGLAGGAAYENSTGISGSARAYWNAFSLSTLTAISLILIGGVVNTALAVWNRRKEKSEGEA